jgi:hypothetical protein
MNFCSSLMMLWQELESSARKICLANRTVETVDCIRREAVFDRQAKGGDPGQVKPGILTRVFLKGGASRLYCDGACG